MAHALQTRADSGASAWDAIRLDQHLDKAEAEHRMTAEELKHTLAQAGAVDLIPSLVKDVRPGGPQPSPAQPGLAFSQNKRLLGLWTAEAPPSPGCCCCVHSGR